MNHSFEPVWSARENARCARIRFAERASAWLMVFAPDESTLWQWGGAKIPAATMMPANLAATLDGLRLAAETAGGALRTLRDLPPGAKITEPLRLEGSAHIYELVAVRRASGELQCTISNITAHERLLQHFQGLAREFLDEPSIQAVLNLAGTTLAELERHKEITELTTGVQGLLDQWAAIYPQFRAVALQYLQQRTEQYRVLRDSHTPFAPLPKARDEALEEFEAIERFMQHAIPRYGIAYATGNVLLLNHAAQGEYADAEAAAMALGIHESQRSVWRTFFQMPETDSVGAHFWAGGIRYRAFQRIVPEGRQFMLAPTAAHFSADPFERIHALKGLGSYLENFPMMRDAGFSAEDIRELLQAFVTGVLCQLGELAAIAERRDGAGDLVMSLADLQRLLEKKSQARSPLQVTIPTEDKTETVPMGIVTAIDLLVDNARRHGAAQRIRVDLRADGQRLSVAVEDNGAGIPADHLARLQRVIDFGQFDAAATTGGHGYGVLTVARTARMLCNGSLSVTSRPGCTRFVMAWDRAC